MSIGAKTSTSSSCVGVFLTGHALSPAAGLGRSDRGSSCDTAQVTEGESRTYLELAPSAGLA